MTRSGADASVDANDAACAGVLDPAVRRILDALAANRPQGDAPEQTVAERRAGLRSLLALSGPAGGAVRAQEAELPGAEGPRAVRIYRPTEDAGKAEPAMLFFHGGGLVAGSLDTHDGICRALAHACGIRILSVDYRLAPEHRYPAALEDGYAAARHLFAYPSEFGVDRDRIVIAGDSAGATLAAAICQRAAKTREFRPAAQFLLCPILDYATRSGSRRNYATGYLLDERTLEHDLRHCLPGGFSPSDPRISPLKAIGLAGVAPACIHTAEFDPLRDEGAEYARRLAKAGVPCRVSCHPGMIHLFYGMLSVIPYAQAAYRRMGDDLHGILGMR